MTRCNAHADTLNKFKLLNRFKPLLAHNQSEVIPKFPRSKLTDLISCSVVGVAKLGQLLVWEWRSESYVLKQQGHYFDISAVAFSPDGSLIATGADDNKVRGV